MKTPGGRGYLSFLGRGLCHSEAKSTTHKSGTVLKGIPINLGKAKNIPMNQKKADKVYS